MGNDENANKSSGDIDIEAGNVIGAAVGIGAQVFAEVVYKDSSALRAWWHEFLRTNGKFPVYAIFLLLASDKAASSYLRESGNEIHTLSGKYCAVIAFSEQHTATNIPLEPEIESRFSNLRWMYDAKEHVDKGYSVPIANMFGVEYTQFPAVILFNDIRSPEHTIVSLKGLSTYEISEKMRSIFSAIKYAVDTEQDPLDTIESLKQLEVIESKKQALQNKAGEVLNKTFEAAMSAWMKATIT